MSKRIDTTLTDRQWDAIVNAVVAYEGELEGQAGTESEGAALREWAVLDRAYLRLRDGTKARP